MARGAKADKEQKETPVQPVRKKIRKEKMPEYNILDKIENNTYQETKVYKSLFHQDYKETGDALFNRNVRHGLR